MADVALKVAPLIPGVKLFMVDGAEAPYESFEDARAELPDHADRRRGRRAAPMLYSSGTTGRPKGVKRADRPASSRSTRPTASR